MKQQVQECIVSIILMTIAICGFVACMCTPEITKIFPFWFLSFCLIIAVVLNGVYVLRLLKIYSKLEPYAKILEDFEPGV